MPDLRRVYVDSCCFIDMVKFAVGHSELNEREKDVWTLKKLLEAHRDKEIKVFTSTLTIAECTHIGEIKLSERVKSEFTRLLMSGQYLHLVQITPFIATDARDLRWNHGINLRGADGIHVACALAMKCEEFLSCDEKLTRVEAQGDKLLNLGLSPRRAAATLCLPEQYRQLGLDNGAT
jgi:predicted nucleic acid-binding protein